ncbi:MAG TPA: endonuclease [Prolixibacteraceae bacterium]|nr:endonuclease [Prolixibacteraceae bacterium]
MKNIFSWFLLFTALTLFSISGIAQPVGFYNGTEGKAGDKLKQVLHEKINHHVDFSYYQAKDLINYSDADPDNPNNVILFYSQTSRDASSYGTGAGTINREHVWAKSHGNFSGIRPMDGDALNLRPADAAVNTNRSNLDFDNVQPNGTQDVIATDCWYNANAYEPGPFTKGQVARILFYMATRYEGTDGEIDLELVSKLNNYPEAQFGNLTTLLEWNNEYPPSDLERQRNDRIFRIQQNRNPFVDHPEFADYIWANEIPSGPGFGNFTMTPEFPLPDETATISLTIKNTTDLSDVSLFWGDAFDSETHQIKMDKSGETYTAILSLSGYHAGDLVNFKVQATSTGSGITNFRGNYLLPEKVSANQLTGISEVQGTGSSSPLVNQNVTISGRVTANFDNSFYLQTGNSKRSGINIYNTLFTGKEGDSLVIRGTASEYSDLTEIYDVSSVYNFKSNQTTEPVVITTPQVNEDYEGMLVQIDNVIFDKPGSVIQEQNMSYTATDNNGSVVVYINKYSRLVQNSFPSTATNLVGVVSQYQGTYQILPRDINDFKVYTANKTLIQAKAETLIVYPNPVTGLLNIKSDQAVSSIKITNLSGQVVRNLQQAQKQVNIQSLSPGIYILEVKFKDETSGYTKFYKLWND